MNTIYVITRPPSEFDGVKIHRWYNHSEASNLIAPEYSWDNFLSPDCYVMDFVTAQQQLIKLLANWPRCTIVAMLI